ncbi:hypothetical protein RJT34_32091 [Clitoria ternatea]|uniref:Beta-glucosidase n=1 Tax=Clitoria ternatea TaxID=43366 RepID=A0AAN9EVE0_CLITE
MYEGAYLSDGKGISNWDVFSHKPGNISDGCNGDVAVDQYNQYLEDIDLMEAIKVNSYRVSISWARILPRIQPFVILFHFDLPQELEDRCGGWLSPQSHEGDSDKEPFVAAHNMILSHAAAVDIYRNKYQIEQGGQIGIVEHIDWFEPLINSTADKLATERAQAFTANWILDPILFGKYPKEMEMVLGTNLPEFSCKDKAKLKRGVDFIGLNYYASYYVRVCISSMCESGLGVSTTEGSYQPTAL